MLIISGRLAREPVLKKVTVEGKKGFVLDNCVFVNSLNKGKNSVPVNISAWDKNATYIAENFEKGDKINLVGIEKLDNIRIENRNYGICTFTVIKVIDWKIYKAINGILSALITRIVNCSDVVAENILSPDLLHSNTNKGNQETDLDTEKEKLEAEKDSEDKEDELNPLNPDEVTELDEENIEPDPELDITVNEDIEDTPEDIKIHESSYVTDDIEPSEDIENEWTPSREPSGYYILDFSYIKKEDYHS